jgi:hypothetical protein
MGHVIIGMDPHKRSATIEVIDSREGILAQGRFGTGRRPRVPGPDVGGRGLRRYRPAHRAAAGR